MQNEGFLCQKPLAVISSVFGCQKPPGFGSGMPPPESQINYEAGKHSTHESLHKNPFESLKGQKPKEYKEKPRNSLFQGFLLVWVRRFELPAS
jgi:hypothetical protein